MGIKRRVVKKAGKSYQKEFNLVLNKMKTWRDGKPKTNKGNNKYSSADYDCRERVRNDWWISYKYIDKNHLGLCLIIETDLKS